MAAADTAATNLAQPGANSTPDFGAVAGPFGLGILVMLPPSRFLVAERWRARRSGAWPLPPAGGSGQAPLLLARHRSATRKREGGSMTRMPNPKGPATAPKSGVEFAPGWARFVAAVSAAAIVVHLLMRFFASNSRVVTEVPLYAALVLGGAPFVLMLARRLWAGEFGSDFLAGASIVTAVLLREYLV